MRFGKALIMVVMGAAALGGCDWMKKKPPVEQKSEKQLAAEQRERIRKACASDGTYDRLKELVFDEAARIRNSDPRNLDPLAASAVVRMENPVVKSRDEDLNVTVCSGRFILELPPGAENAFDGNRRLTADVEYAAQAAVDGSGLVYQMDGAEPIIYRLASFGLNGQPLPKMVAVPQPSAPPAAPPEVALMEPVPVSAAPSPPPAPRPVPKAAPRPAEPKIPPAQPRARPAEPAPVPVKAAARPSFNCRYAKTPSEKLVCASPGLAARDRAMSSLYYSAIAGADPATKNRIRASRDAFLARRERCGDSESCAARVYEERIAEIRRLARE